MKQPQVGRDAHPAPALHCLGGAVAPPELGPDLLLLLELPDRAQRKLWDALGPALADPLPDDVEPLLTHFCKEHQIGDEALARPLKASRFVLRAAAEVDLERTRFGEDIAALGGARASRLAEVLMGGFDAAKAFVRRGLVQRSLEAHGKTVERVTWRIDRIVASSEANNLEAAVAIVTLDCREGGKRERMTLQLPSDILAELARAHDRMVR